MNLSDWIHRADLRVAEGITTFEQVLESAFPHGHPHHDLIPRILADQAFPDREGEAVVPHVTVPGLARPELVVVLVPEGVLLAGDRVRLWVVALFGSQQPELRLQILSLVAGFCRQAPFDADPEEFYRRISQFSAPGNRVFASLSIDRVNFELGARLSGLTAAEVAERLTSAGQNLLKPAPKPSPVVTLLKNFASVFALLLWAAGGLCFLPGVGMPALGWAIFAVVVINGVFSFWQESKAERAVEALQNLLPRLATVTRDGEEAQIQASDLVPGDILTLEEGDRVPADVRLVEADDLRVDNSNLTGESRPLYKMAEPLTGELAFLWTEVPNLVFAGTSVASGRGRGVVIGTGMQTEIGKIAGLTQSVHREPSPLQKEMQAAVNILTVVSLALGGVFFFLGQFFGGMTVLGAFLFTIGITVANIPEGLLPTLSLSLALGVQRMALRRVLVKDLASVETLGGTTVICTDKTGTLTTNQVQVREIWADDGLFSASGNDLTALAASPVGTLFLQVAVLCNNSRLIEGGTAGDPTEGALLALAVQAGGDPSGMRLALPRLGLLPFESVRKRMSTLHRFPEGDRVMTKGAPMELLDRCTHLMVAGGIVPLDAPRLTALRTVLDGWARLGRRTLGLATRLWPGAEPFAGETAETGLVFLGAVGMVDPPRPEVPQAVALCRRAGIRMAMVTGDYGPTAAAIAEEIGMSTPGDPARVFTGRQVEGLGVAGLADILAVPGPLIFSRMEPGHKMLVVTAFQLRGDIVAVTGDGINDAAALKRADIGIAMGAGVNDVVKEAACMVVLDGNFASIVAAIREGRAVYANIRRFVTYVFASNVPELVPFLLSVLLGIPLPLTVLQILAVDLGTDMIPALGLGTEAPEPGLMDRPPRPRKQRLFSVQVFLRGYLFLGLLEAGLSLGAYFWAYAVRGWSWGLPLASSGPVYQAATTMALAGIVACQVGAVLACRTDRASIFEVGLGSNRVVLWGIGTELVVLGLLTEVPFFQGVFGLVALGWSDLVLLPLFPLILLGAEELRKAWARHRTKPARPA